MRRLIPSEEQAEAVGQKLTAGTRGKHFEVFWYEHRPSKLTLFFVHLFATEQTITTLD